MTNKDIIRTVAECSNPYKYVIEATCKIKDEDFLKKIDEVLQYHDCDAYGKKFYTFKKGEAKDAFLFLLNLISKKEHRNINPYVIVYEFKLIQ